MNNIKSSCKLKIVKNQAMAKFSLFLKVFFIPKMFTNLRLMKKIYTGSKYQLDSLTIVDFLIVTNC